MATLTELCITGSLFAIVAAILRFTLKRRLPNFFYFWLWNIELFLFFIPIRLSSLFSVYNLLPNTKSLGNALSPQLLVQEMTSLNIQNTSRALVDNAQPPTWYVVVWISGMVVCLLYFLVNWICWRIKLRGTFSLDWKAEKRGRSIDLLVADCVDSPCVYGVIRPKIIFPTFWDFGDEQGTKLAITHELAHIAHLDNIRKIAFSFLVCVQWFNPVVWITSYMANKDMELYCDGCVIKGAQVSDRQKYASLLLQRRAALPIASTVGFLETQKASLRERIVFIMTDKKPNKRLKIVSMFCLVALFAAFATAASPLLYEQDKGIGELGIQGEANTILANHPTMYNYSNSAIDLSNGDILLLSAEQLKDGQLQLPIIPVKGYDNGQPAQYGYVKNGKHVSLGETNLYDGIVLDFSKSASNAEKYYIKNYCVDTLHISE